MANTFIMLGSHPVNSPGEVYRGRSNGLQSVTGVLECFRVRWFRHKAKPVGGGNAYQRRTPCGKSGDSVRYFFDRTQISIFFLQSQLTLVEDYRMIFFPADGGKSEPGENFHLFPHELDNQFAGT